MVNKFGIISLKKDTELSAGVREIKIQKHWGDIQGGTLPSQRRREAGKMEGLCEWPGGGQWSRCEVSK